MSLPPPLPKHLFGLMLQYLLPPSPPIPSNLLSAALLQRHYFLSIDHSSDPADYFLQSKDATDREAIITTLEQTATYDMDHLGEDTTYTVTNGILEAKVTLAEKLKVVFVLEDRTSPDSGDGREEAAPEWRYHDVVWDSTTKEHPSSHASIEAALAAAPPPAADETGDDDQPEEQRADDFWDGWEASSDQPLLEGKTRASADLEETEDRYYERYSDVPLAADGMPTVHVDDPIPISWSGTGITPTTIASSTPDDAAKSIVMGAYRLWKASRASELPEEKQRRAFLDLVASAIE